MSEMKKMYDQAKVLQKKLAQMVIDVEENNVKVVVTGDVKIKELIIDGAPNKRVLDAINKALDKAQKQAAKQMQEDAGGISGLLKGFGY